MKIVILTGSPRKKGNSNYLAQQFAKGAEEAGHEVFTFHCADYGIHPCIGCNKCGMNGDCVFHDDFYIVRPKLVGADMVVFTTPVYYFAPTAQLKTVIDRFQSIYGVIEHKKTALITTQANPDPVVAEPTIATYKACSDFLKWEDKGIVTATGLWAAHEVETMDFPRQAYELGKSL